MEDIGNIRDMKFNSNLYLEKTYHTFSDKMHQAYRVIADGASVNVTTFGLETQITSYTAVEIYDGTNTYTSVSSVPSGADIQYVAAKTSAGVVGLIFAGEDTNVTVTTSGSTLVIKQSIAPGTLADGSEAAFGNRLYTDATQDFAGIQAANNEEQNPLTAENITVNENVDGSKFLGYNHLTGAYDFQVNGSGLWAYAEEAQKQKKFASHITVDGATDDRRIYLCVNMDQIMEGATLVDATNKLVPIPLQGTKNMSDVTEEPIYNATDARHGATYMPLSVKADNKYQFTILNVYETWGNFRMKQLSSVDYYTSYYHISTGVTETTCIAPYSSAYRKSGGTGAHTYFTIPWFLPDFRGMSSESQYVDSSSTDPVQKNSAGTVFMPTNNTSHTMDSKYQWSDIQSSGLTYVDLDHSYISNDGNYKYTMRHVEMPQNDETRTYYTIDIEILKNCTLNKNTFNIVGVGSRGKTSDFGILGSNSVLYSKASYLNTSGSATEVSTTSSTSSSNYALNSGSSYFALYDLNVSGAENANVGVIVKSCQRVGTNGATSDLALSFQNSKLSVDSWGGYITYGGLTLANNTTFSAGEHIVANVILLPYGALNQTNADNVKKVYEDSVTNALQVSVVNGVGTVVEDTFIPTVKGNGSKAQFTVSGGTSVNYDTTNAGVNYTMKVTGFTKLTKPVVQEYVNGSWVRYDLSTDTALGCDGYAVERAADGTYTYSFVFNKQHNVDRIFAVSAN